MPSRTDMIEKMTAADKLLRLGTFTIFAVLLLLVTVRSFGDGPLPQAERVAEVPNDTRSDVALAEAPGAPEISAEVVEAVESETEMPDVAEATADASESVLENTVAEAGSEVAAEEATPSSDQVAMAADATVNWLQESPLLASADIGNGEGVFRQCATCHQYAVERNGGGPHLVGIVGRDIGTAESWRYSKALLEAEGIWTPERLNEWLTNPDDYIPGNRMAYPGVRDAKDRIDLIGFLASQGQ